MGVDGEEKRKTRRMEKRERRNRVCLYYNAVKERGEEVLRKTMLMLRVCRKFTVGSYHML